MTTNTILDRHKQVVQATQSDAATAATLVLAEQVATLVRLLTNVDTAVSRIEQQAQVQPEHHEVVADIAPLPVVNVTVTDQAAVQYLRENYK